MKKTKKTLWRHKIAIWRGIPKSDDFQKSLPDVISKYKNELLENINNRARLLDALVSKTT